MGIAFDYIRNGNSVIDTQQEIGYDSGNGFRDAFTKIMGTLPKKHKEITLFISEWIETPIGSMIAIAKENSLYLLEFTDRRGLEKEIENLRKKFNGAIIPGTNQISILIPCHRIINTNGELGGYGGGVQRKKWLLEMEKKNYK